MKYLVILLIISIHVPAYSQVNHDSSNYFLKLEGGRVIHGNIEYYIPRIGGDYVKVNDTSYYISDISSFNCPWGYFAKFQADSDKNNMEIFKRSHEGKIEFYSGKTTLFTGGVGNMGPMAYDYQEKYFSKDKVHLYLASYDNLSRNLNDNPKSMEFLQQYTTAQNWKWRLAGVGIMGLMVGTAQITNKQLVAGPLVMLASIVLFQLSWDQDGIQDIALKNAVNAYNE